jgi:hypothetical protein
MVLTNIFRCLLPKRDFLSVASYIVIFLAIVIRLIVFLWLPSKPSNLAPDEGTYLALLNWILQGKNASDFPVFGQSFYETSRSLILPSYLFSKLGFDALYSLRITSLLYAIGSLFLFKSVSKAMLSSYKTAQSTNSRVFATRFLTSLAIFSFLPSHLLWSVLALRESALVFGLLLTTFSLLFLMDKPHSLTRNSLLILGFQVGLLLVWSARFQVGILLILVLVFFLFFTKFKIRNASLIIFCLLASIFITNTSQSPLPDFGSNNSISTLQFPKDSTDAHTIRTEADTSESQKSSSNKSPWTIIGQIPSKSEGNRIGANSSLDSLECSYEHRFFLNVFCVFSHYIEKMLSVMFRPMLLLDTGTSIYMLASIENVIWSVLFIIVFIKISNILFFVRYCRIQLFILLFFICYLLGMTLYEGNLGTAFRHKSTLLWCLALIVSVTPPRKRFRLVT